MIDKRLTFVAQPTSWRRDFWRRDFRQQHAGARRAIALSLAAMLLATPAAAQSITDRFKSLFGGGSEPQAPPAQDGAAASPPQDTDLTCPDVTVRSGASTYAVGLPNKEAAGSDLRYQATISRMARSCTLSDGLIKAKIGIQGRVIAGPAGAPTSVEVPLRVAVVHEGVQPKTVFTQAYRTTVAMTPDGNEPFTLVIEDVAYPVPAGNANDYYVFYIGFDPQALKPEPRKRKAK